MANNNKTIALAANTDWYIYNFRRNLILLLQQYGLDIYTVTPAGNYVHELVKLGCTHIPWNVGRQSLSPVSELQSILDLRNIYRDISPALIHQHTLKTVIYGSLAERSSGIPIINSIPGRGFIYSSQSLKAKMARPIVDLLLKLSMSYLNQKVIFENPADMDYFLKRHFVKKNQSHLIQSVGVDTKYYQSTQIPDFQNFTVGFVGRMLWDKGVGVFVDAARLVRSSNPEIKMVLIGLPDSGNPASISTEQLQSWEQEELIEWWRWQENMPAAYSRLHTLAFPTNYAEGVPTVLLEAAASERALIASNTPSCREVVDDGVNGYLVPPNDSKVLAEKILLMASDESEYHRLRQNAYQKVTQTLSTDKVNQKTLDIYQELLGFSL